MAYDAGCAFNFNSDQCVATINPQWVVRDPFVSISGYLQYSHDSNGFHNETTGVFENHGFKEDDVLVKIPARVFFVDHFFVPKMVATVVVARTHCSVLSVFSSTTTHAQMTIELRDEPSAVTLRDGTPLKALGVQYQILPYVPPSRQRAVRH